MAMEKLLQSKRKIQKINEGAPAATIPDQAKRTLLKRPKFEERHQRVTIYLLNTLYDDFTELRNRGYKQTDLMNEAVQDLIQKYTQK